MSPHTSFATIKCISEEGSDAAGPRSETTWGETVQSGDRSPFPATASPNLPLQSRPRAAPSVSNQHPRQTRDSAGAGSSPRPPGPRHMRVCGGHVKRGAQPPPWARTHAQARHLGRPHDHKRPPAPQFLTRPGPQCQTKAARGSGEPVLGGKTRPRTTGQEEHLQVQVQGGVCGAHPARGTEGFDSHGLRWEEGSGTVGCKHTRACASRLCRREGLRLPPTRQRARPHPS